MMRTQMTNGTTSKRPSLEFFPKPGEAPRRVPLDPLPFTIGRIDTADLQIDSTRVSRQHAQIALENGRFMLRDLGSTNGTYVNGKPVQSASLSDGDTVLVADFELTFVAAAGERIRRMATQLMTGVESPRVSTPGFGDELDDLRRMHEILLQGLVFPEVEEIVTLPDKRVFAVYAASPTSGDNRESPQLALLSYSLPGHPSVRYQELYRTLAQQGVLEAAKHKRLMVDIATWEVEVNASLPLHLARLADLWPSDGAFSVCLAADAVADLHEVARCCKELRELGVAVCYRDFVGSGSQVQEFRDSPPDFLMLAPSMLRAGLRHEHQFQKLQSVFAACQELGCRPILAGVNGQEIEEACYELGCELAWIVRPQGGAANHAPAREVACAV
jgi:pSer/pThr/pTyr-binding forkhead associated (FHA) protein